MRSKPQHLFPILLGGALVLSLLGACPSAWAQEAIDIPVAASSDDAGERITSSVSLTSGDPELVFNSGSARGRPPHSQLVWIWLAIGTGFLILFVYPYTIYPLLLRLLPKRYYFTESNGATSDTSVAALFCAYNEAAVLPKKIANLRLLKARVPQLQVYAYSDGSDDGTNDILEASKDLISIVYGKKRVGKARGMRELVTRTDAEILVFTDANTIVEPQGLERLINYFNDPEIGAVAGTLLYVDDESTRHSSAASVGGMYWRLEEHIKQQESITGSTMGCDGGIFARRRNGYPEIPGSLLDDMATSMSVLFDGMRCVSAPDVLAHEHSVSSTAEEFRRKRRIACRSYSTYRYLKPNFCKLSALDKFKFVSHKLLRWWGGFSLLAALLCLQFAAFTAGMILPSLLFFLAASVLLIFAFYFKVPIVATAIEIGLAVIATGIGIVESMVGKKYSTWSPAKSRSTMSQAVKSWK